MSEEKPVPLSPDDDLEPMDLSELGIEESPSLRREGPPPVPGRDEDEIEAIPISHDEAEASVQDDEDEPLTLVESEDDEDSGMSKIKIGGALGSATAHEKREYKRPLNCDGSGATRVRIFHSKIADAPLRHMESTINEWIDETEVEVKHVGHMVGTLEGKIAEPNMFVLVWY